MRRVGIILYFEEITKETLYIALEIVNSNPEYNVLENGNENRTPSEIEGEYLNPKTSSEFVKLDDTYIGVIDYLMENPKDNCPWLGLLMIHRDYQGYGFGLQAYALYENEMQSRGVERVRVGVISENTSAHRFWLKLGFLYIKTANWKNGKEILCYEKNLQ
jgi:RimJ/RimL family protein N-acetyltransferase